MPRPKKIKDENSKNTIEEIITKMKNNFPQQEGLIDEILENVNKNNYYIITDKKDNYYLDDFNGVWNEKLELVGAYENNKIHLYQDIKKITDKITNRIS